jgi:hypothetical protein
VACEALEHCPELSALSRIKRSKQVAFGGLDRALCLRKAAPSPRGRLNEVTAPVGRVPRSDDQAFILERVEKPDEVAWIDPQRCTEILLRERPGLFQVLEDGEGMCVHLHRGERLSQPRAGHPRQPEYQQGAAGFFLSGCLAGCSAHAGKS